MKNTISIYWSKRPKKLPVVFTKSEAIEVLNNLKGTHWMVGMLLYGSGLRLSESLELRVKDIDFGYNQIIVRDSKGGQASNQRRWNNQTCKLPYFQALICHSSS